MSSRKQQGKTLIVQLILLYLLVKPTFVSQARFFLL